MVHSPCGHVPRARWQCRRVAQRAPTNQQQPIALMFDGHGRARGVCQGLFRGGDTAGALMMPSR